MQRYQRRPLKKGVAQRYIEDTKPTGRNIRKIRNVWTITGRCRHAEAHFATFPPGACRTLHQGRQRLERGCCPESGRPWRRNTVRDDQGWDGSRYGERAVAATGGAKTGGTAHDTLGSSNRKLTGQFRTISWSPDCECSVVSSVAIWLCSVACVVLDPFGGAGTTGLVADRLGRDAIMVELNPRVCRDG